MSVKPSRSEIESALSSNKKRLQTAKQNTSSDFVLEGKSHRKQTVLGGNLAGVSKPRRFDINYVNWILSAIVVLILIAFFLPTSQDSSIAEVPSNQKTTNAQPFYNTSRVDTEVQKNDQDGLFSKNDDIERAEVYREQEKRQAQIVVLFNKAEKYIEDGQYTLPKNSNAYQSYLDILSIDPNNHKAKQGISYIETRFVSVGLASLKKDDENSAVDALKKLKLINDKSKEFNRLQSKLKLWRKDKQVNELLTHAKAAYSNKLLILPASESALYFYRKILAIDPAQPDALKGITFIADNYVEKANQAILDGEYEAATGYLTTVSVIKPEHDSIDLIRQMITNAKAISVERQSNAANNLAISANTLPVKSVTPEISEVEPSTTTSTTASQKTPQQQSKEQRLFDRQYLANGLSAYYKGDYETAKALLKPLADKGISRAQFRIGYMYFLGRGLSKDRDEADRIIRAALPAVQKFADEGRAWAQSDIGSLYEDGLVLPKDYSEAVYWYRRAAEQGYPGAQTNLGIMYAYGRGVNLSRKTAIEWFQRAAKQGDVAAMRNLASLGIKI